MKIKLNNNQNLTQPILTSNFKHKCESIYIANCGNTMNAKTFLDAVIAYQRQQIEQGRMEQMVLGAFAVDLPYDSARGRKQYSGTFDELMSYQNFRGASLTNGDSGKPIFNGTWILTDYVDQSDLDAIAAKFNMDHLTLEHPHFLDWDSYAVQSVDSTRKNYNPTVSIVLNAHGVGDLVERSARRAGRYVFTKADAEELEGIGNWFSGLTSAEDTDKIVTNYSGTAPSYGFTSFNELSSFTGLTRIDSSAFENDTSLTTIVLPDSILSIGEKVFAGCSNVDMPSLPSEMDTVSPSAFFGCSNLTLSALPDSVECILDGAFGGCAQMDANALPPSLTYIGEGAFSGCSNVAFHDIPVSLTHIGGDAFSNCTGIPYLNFKRRDTVTAVTSSTFDGTNFPIRIGDSESAYLDSALKDRYVADENWNAYSARISSNYRVEYSEKLATTQYEFQDFVDSDGLNVLQTGSTYVDGTRFCADIGFMESAPNSGDSVHGSASIGLKGAVGYGLTATLGDHTETFRTSAEYLDGNAHAYEIDLENDRLTYDGKVRYDGDDDISGDGSAITLFGESEHPFVGVSWMNRIYGNGTLLKDYAPAYDSANGRVGFLDVESGTFVGGEFYHNAEHTLSFSSRTSESDTEEYRFVTEGGDVLVF